MKPRHRIIKPNFPHAGFFEVWFSTKNLDVINFAKNVMPESIQTGFQISAPLRLPTMRRVAWHVRSAHFWYEGKARVQRPNEVEALTVSNFG